MSETECPAAAPRARSTYHHGELPDTLMDLAIVQIGRVGIEKLSLRALAREAGVSATAPYRHYPSRQCLLAAIATRGFRQLTGRMLDALEPAGDARQRFVRFGRAYVDFARADPVSYELMFGGVVDFNRYPDLKGTADGCFLQLLDVLRRNREGRLPESELLGLAAAVWAGVHGVASLLVSKMTGGGEGADASPASAAIRQLGADPDHALHLLFDHLVGPPLTSP